MLEIRLPALALPGLTPDSLGIYLASLGLLRVLSRKWPSVRIAWRDEVLQLVGGPRTQDELLDELMRVAEQKEWSPYDKPWAEAQKKGTKSKSGEPLALWQAQAEEGYLELFAAHAVPHERVAFNPLLGSGGNSGRRDFATGWQNAVSALKTGPRKTGGRRKETLVAGSAAVDERRTELVAFLLGSPATWLVEKLAGGCWFSEGTKLHNSGQSPARDGQLSPWAMALACEGLVLMAGAASRRLGVRSRSFGSFPFVTQPVAPAKEKEAGRVQGEVWAPLWTRPMTMAEAGVLFSRGRAEVRGRGAVTPAAFATAILDRGVDAGVTEFRRFTLINTTSKNTFEPHYEARFSVDPTVGGAGSAISSTLERVTALIEHRGFPRDGNRFAGLRGPIESALLELAADPGRSELGVVLLDAIVRALDRIDRNRTFREAQLRWQPLPLEWLPTLFDGEQPMTEARLALSLVSSFPKALPFTAYRFGVGWTHGAKYNWSTTPDRFEHSKVPPPRWVWGPGEPVRVLEAVMLRRLLEEGKLVAPNTVQPPGRAPLPATTAQLHTWLVGDVDESVLLSWVSRLALFDWRTVPPWVQSLALPNDAPLLVDGQLAVLGLLQPLVDRRPLLLKTQASGDLLADETGARTPEAARSLVAMIRSGDIDSAIQLAGRRYAMAGARLASFDVVWCARHAERLVAALLFTISDRDRAVLLERWLCPRRQQPGDQAHV